MPRSVVWTPELISRFWSGVANIDAMTRLSFGKLAGPLVAEFASAWVTEGAQCLDYGGGDGFLVESLTAAGIMSAAYEPNPVRARRIDKIAGASPLYLGTIGAEDQRSFDFVFCTEVIEHVLPGGLDDFAQAVVRRIVPGGRLLLTTPHAEDLSASQVYCPVCDSTFHRWQHQRSCTPGDIVALFDRHGLHADWVGLVGFDDGNAIRDFVLRRRLGDPWVAYHEETTGSRLPIIGRGDHIVYIGRKVARAGDCEDGQGRSEREALLDRGIASAVRLGGRPVVVVPPEEIPNVCALRIDAEISSAEDQSAIRDPNRVIVMPSSYDCFEGAVRSGRIRGDARAVVLDAEEWEQLIPSVCHRRRTPAGTARGGLARWVNRKVEQAGRAMRLVPLARRVQPWFDRREALVLETLLNPLDFPMRLTHVRRGRVLLAIGTLGSGGAERQLVNTAEGLAARGVDIHILVNHLHDDPANAFFLGKAKSVAEAVHESKPLDPLQFPWVAGDPALRRAVGDGVLARILSDAEVIERVAPEIVHASLDWTNVTVGMAAVLAGVPRVFLSGRNLSPLYFPFFQWFMYPCYRALAECSGVHLLNNSDAGRIDYAKWLRIDANRIRVLRNGLHANEFPLIDADRRIAARKKLGLRESDKVVVGAFRLSPEKRPLLWIDTAAEIRAALRDAKFLVCGVGPELDAMKRRALRRGLEGAIQFLGACEDMHTIFSAADVVLQTSLQEGTPNVLIEAQASGLPVVTTPAYGAAEAVQNGVTGYVVDAGRAKPIAHAVLGVLNDAAFAASARAAARPFIEERFGYQRMIDDTLEAYADAGAEWAAQLLPSTRRFLAYEELRNMYHDSGAAWIVRLPELTSYADSLSAPARSPLRILEDGQPLGPAHTAHDTIREKGGGAYSHWGDVLYFSTSDGSDPRTNGRSYVALIPRGHASA